MDPRSVHGKTDALQIIDVREHGEWKAGHIDGAQHIPMGEIPTRLDEIDDDKPLVAICRSGTRSAQVTVFLRDKGFDIENLEGGMKVWAKAGLPIEDANGRPGRVV
ncbi:MAG TPA: rhodanese-like domain-containing protein [Actinomycetota bacterium]|nr:rhodanese-like domain-containing protein [Actinomycetota bacterium]